MNDTQQSPPHAGSSAGPEDEFDPHRLRSITDMLRSSDDRLIAGVCAGAARYLNIDPIVVRVVIAVLTLAGFAGVIIYVAAWFLLPADDADRSVAAEWFNLDKNEEQVRIAGLVAAVILAALSIVGDSSWAWWGDAPWWILPFALVFYVFWVRPRRRRAAREAAEHPATAHDPVGVHDPATVADVHEPHPSGTTQQAAVKPRRRRSPALLVLTLSIAAIALAATRIYDETQDDVPWTTYVAVALAVVGLGLLIGTFFGNGGLLIGIGVILAVVLAVGSLLPNGRIGSQQPTPSVAADVKSTYTHGLGQLELDLTQVADPDGLLGRTVHLEAGVGQTRVLVPDTLNVRVEVDLDAGEYSLFGRQDDGTDLATTSAPGRPSQAALTIEIEQRLGQIEVIRQ